MLKINKTFILFFAALFLVLQALSACGSDTNEGAESGFTANEPTDYTVNTEVHNGGVTGTDLTLERISGTGKAIFSEGDLMIQSGGVFKLSGTLNGSVIVSAS